MENVRGRPRSFDKDDVLERITCVFWERGFDGATYEQMEAETGLKRQSLIYAFGDKRALFLAALQHYRTTRVEAVCAALASAKTAKQGVAAAFDIWRGDASRQRHRGCLLVTTAGEVAPFDADVAKQIAIAHKKLLTAFEDAFEQAGAERSLQRKTDAAALAMLAVATGDGSLLHARNENDGGSTQLALDSLFSLIFD
ncbi:MAG: TetR/AcrR family transcriptional regulator [Hyphomicrobiales bacterium]|nr:TetR/AcrR family transcriptional regulator [Hyphomicrobiales bacterium]